MKAKSKFLSSTGFICMILIFTVNIFFGLESFNISSQERNAAIILLFLPVLFIVYHLTKDNDEIPKYIINVALISASFYLLYILLKSTILFSYFMVDETEIFTTITVKIMPIAITSIIILTSLTKSLSQVILKVSKYLMIILAGTLTLLLLYTLVLHVYQGTTVNLLHDGPIYILSYIGTLTPLSYLIFFKEKIDKKYIARDYSIGIFIAGIFLLYLSVVASSRQANANMHFFEEIYNLQYYADSYGYKFAWLLMTVNAVLKVGLATFIYLSISNKRKELESEKQNTKQSHFVKIINLLCIVILIFFATSNTWEGADFAKLISRICFSVQALYLCVIVANGFYLGLRKYHSRFVDAGLFVFPSFVFIYLVYNLAKVWEFLPSLLVRQFTSIQNIVLILSLTVLFFYILETILLWYAYSKRLRIDDFEVIENPVENDIYVIVPCLNEELVIENTLRSILKSKYANLSVFVIDDASEDETILKVKNVKDKRLHLIERKKPNAQEGKGESLNYGYQIIKDRIVTSGKNFDQSLIAIIDADTIIPDLYFENVNKVFNSDEEITGLQSKVRVVSQSGNKSQDLEFSEIINATQTLRTLTGTVAFGGNGQFCKLSMLDSLEKAPWSKSLVEDYDLSTRLFLGDQKSKNIQVDDIYITQSGIDKNVELLVKQRVRWAQGNVQSSKYIFPILRSKKLALKQKLEFMMTLLKPWLMAIEYVVVIYSSVLILDLYLLYGMNRLMYRIIAIFLAMLLLVLIINFIWACLYNKNKKGKEKYTRILHDTLNLTLFLLTLSQIYPQAMIRHFKSQSDWDKTNRQTDMKEM